MMSVFYKPPYQLLILPFIIAMFFFAENTAAQNHTVEFNVVVTVKGFEPSVIEVPRGSEVRLIFTTPDTEHSVTPSAFGVEKTVILPGGETVLEFTAEESGTFKLGCTTLCSYRHFLFMRPVLFISVLP
jgi:heme/copper-type cytochrome/quinol oxidase subunit 2